MFFFNEIYVVTKIKLLVLSLKVDIIENGLIEFQSNVL